MRYVVNFEENSESLGTYVSGLPGCVAFGETREVALQLIREVIRGMKQDGDPIPESHSYSEVVQVSAA